MSNLLMIHRPDSLDIFRRLFDRVYGLVGVQDSSLCELARIVHWNVHMGMIGCQEMSINHRPTWVMGGAFYNFSSPVLSFEAVQSQRSKYPHINYEQILIPTVRREDSSEELSKNGFIRIPAFIESVFEFKHSLEVELSR